MEQLRLSKGEFADSIEQRLKTFTLRCIQVFRALPASYESQHFGKQLIRSSSSSAANYRAVRRARSQNEFYAKISIVIEELDESLFWLEMLVFSDILPEHRLHDLLDEGYQLLKILAKSRSNTGSS
ncbi:four helix bundle protein [Telluribacter sp. SYSU D00476]|uniref:four helix bundle protein n=1 Tax=Telluribacter sp. SYSU D00476 TaxID=2811430 RepID=UPI001FF2C14D|nr:four helix bundle protein [Telluribacter sp. SYSU D00476]